MTFDEARALLIAEGAADVEIEETPEYRGLCVRAFRQDGTQIGNAVVAKPDSSADQPYRMLSFWLKRNMAVG